MKAAPNPLQSADALMAIVDAALRQIVEGPSSRQVPGARNVLVFGGAFLGVMKQAAARDPLFAIWLEQQQMQGGIEVLREILLREPKVRRDYTQVHLASAGKEFGPRPANARAFFSGDWLGGSGWELELPGGRVEKYYVSLPDDLPAGYSFGGEGVAVDALARRYVSQLREMLRYARVTIPGL